MTRRSRREIAKDVADLEGAHRASVPEDVDVIDQWLSPKYPDPGMEALSVAWRQELQPNEGCGS